MLLGSFPNELLRYHFVCGFYRERAYLIERTLPRPRSRKNGGNSFWDGGSDKPKSGNILVPCPKQSTEKEE